MAGEVYGKPPVPPASKHGKQIVTRFDGWIVSNGSGRGHHRFTIGVAPEEIYKAMLMIESPMLLHFEVYGVPVSEMTEEERDAELELDEEAAIDRELREALNLEDL